MAAKDAAVACPAGEWTLLTDNAGTSGNVSIALVSGGPVWLKASTTTTAPSGADGTLSLIKPGEGWSEATIAAKFPGVASATHIFARPVGAAAAVVGISHA